MRVLSSFFRAAAAMTAVAIAVPPQAFMMPHAADRHHGAPPKHLRNRPGAAYPHSSTRQRARYARQIAAGQLRMAGAGMSVGGARC